MLRQLLEPRRIVVITPMLIGGWYAVRGKDLTMAEARVGYTGEYPVVPGIVPPVPFPEHERKHHDNEGDK